MNRRISKLCAFHIFEGLREGLSHFSGHSRAAIIYAAKKDGPMYVFDPQHLLHGHEPKLRDLYLASDEWRTTGPSAKILRRMNQPWPEKNLNLAGLVSKGGRSPNIFYQMWFTEHHPDMCSTGPTERWLEHAVWLLSHDVSSEDASYAGVSAYVLREYATHAVRDYIIDEINLTWGMDVHLRIYPILDAVLGVSKTVEEGKLPRGKIAFAEPKTLPEFNFLAKLNPNERPSLRNSKHVRKMLQAVENADRSLVSDGVYIVGIADGAMPSHRITADFKAGFGFLSLNGDPVCSFYDGGFHSSTCKAKMVELEEFLLEIPFDPPSVRHSLFKIVSDIVHNSEDRKCGCTLVIDLNAPMLGIAGQHPEAPLNLEDPHFLDLAKSLSMLDGALHIGADLHLHGFACILDGRRIPGEDRARGARFNSALRFTAENRHVVVVVVSSDRPVSIIQEGVELNAQCVWKPVSARLPHPPTLEEWLAVKRR